MIQLQQLLELLGRLTLLDVRWDVAGGPDPHGYRTGHIPGAAFVDLDHELAGPPGPRGRHPLPDPDQFAAAMRQAGVSQDRRVVAYDAGTGTAAARAWWLLRYFGHHQVAVLDGGLGAWIAAGHSLERGPVGMQPGDFIARPGGMPLLDAQSAAELAQGGVLLDARAPERFSGQHEPIDPVAGHIPAARNRPTSENLEPSGRFRSPHELRHDFDAAGVAAATPVGAYCGSGVAAAQEVLALELAGFQAALYVGSWSEWITDPDRPVATGA
ncbi:MAG: sulfurtransferase [Solirubrobacteraceae bacterium]